MTEPNNGPNNSEKYNRIDNAPAANIIFNKLFMINFIINI